MLKKTCKEVKSIIKYINTKKALQNGNLPITVSKENMIYFPPDYQKCSIFILTKLSFQMDSSKQ